METELKNHIAAIVRAARKGKGITQEELASRIKRTPESLSNVERGNAVPSIDTLVCLCQELDIDPNVIFKFEQSGGSSSQAEHRIIQEIVQLLNSLDRDTLNLAKTQMQALHEHQKKKEIQNS